MKCSISAPIPWSVTIVDQVVSRLQRWYREHHRDLPWRGNTSPYSVYVAEIMLQQTRVDTVVPYFLRFMERFPTIEDLAAASVDDVLSLWAGLGYYRRARALHASAQRIVRDHGGHLPRDKKALESLPGVGRYTAGAVLSIGYGLPAPILDGNVMRVLTRLGAHSGDPRKNPLNRELWQIAEQLVGRGTPSLVNQGLMELGALICLPDRPRCGVCPLQITCRAYYSDRTTTYPQGAPRRPSVRVEHSCAVVMRRGRYLLGRIPDGCHSAGLWEFPTTALEDGEDIDSAARRAVRDRVGLEVVSSRPLGRIRHTITHHRITLHVIACKTRGRARSRGYDEVRWYERHEFDQLALPSSQRRIVQRFLTEE